MPKKTIQNKQTEFTYNHTSAQRRSSSDAEDDIEAHRGQQG